MLNPIVNKSLLTEGEFLTDWLTTELPLPINFARRFCHSLYKGKKNQREISKHFLGVGILNSKPKETNGYFWAFCPTITYAWPDTHPLHMLWHKPSVNWNVKRKLEITLYLGRRRLAKQSMDYNYHQETKTFSFQHYTYSNSTVWCTWGIQNVYKASPVWQSLAWTYFHPH